MSYTTIEIKARRADPVRPGDPEWEDWLAQADLSQEEFEALWRSRWNSAQEFLQWMKSDPAQRWADQKEATVKERVDFYKSQVDDRLGQIKDEIKKPIDQIQSDYESLKKAVEETQNTIHRFIRCYTHVEVSKNQQRINRFLMVGILSCLVYIFILHPLIKSGIRFGNVMVEKTQEATKETKSWLADRLDELTGNVELRRKIKAQAEKWLGREVKENSEAFTLKTLTEVGVKVDGKLFQGGAVNQGEIRTLQVDALEKVEPGDLVLSQSGEIGIVISPDEMISVKNNIVTKIPLDFKAGIQFNKVSNKEIKGLGSQTLALMSELKYDIDPEFNIVYLRNFYCDEFNQWCDRLMVIDGTGKILFESRATSEPGAAGYKSPANSRGVFQIDPGQYKNAWEVGQHCGMRSRRCQEALVQIGVVKGTRSLYPDRRNPVPTQGLFGINIHGSREEYKKTVDGYSEGCLVVSSMPDQRKFMKLMKSFDRSAYGATIIDIKKNPLPPESKFVPIVNSFTPQSVDDKNIKFIFPVPIDPAKATIGRGYSGKAWHPIWQKYTSHLAVDIPAPQGTQYLAAESGTVTFAGLAGNCGGMMIIRHSPKLSTKVCHLNKFIAKTGDKVSQGQPVALVGGEPKTWGAGASTGAHLHFAVHEHSGANDEAGTPVNPKKYLPMLVYRKK